MSWNAADSTISRATSIGMGGNGSNSHEELVVPGEVMEARRGVVGSSKLRTRCTLPLVVEGGANANEDLAQRDDSRKQGTYENGWLEEVMYYDEYCAQTEMYPSVQCRKGNHT